MLMQVMNTTYLNTEYLDVVEPFNGCLVYTFG